MNIGALEWVLKQLDTLQEKSEKPINPTIDTLQEQPGKHNALFDSCLAKVNPETREEVRKNIDKMIEQPVELDDAINNWQGIEAFPEGCGITPLPKAMEIVDKTARHFYELGRQSKGAEWTEEDIKNGSYISAFLQANCGDSVILKRATIWFMSRLKQLPIQQSKLEVCEGLEEEINRLSKNEYFDFTDWKAIARHFAKWQKEQMMKDCVHEVNQAYFRGIEVGKAEMMKEAVEGEVYLYHSYNRNATAIVVDIPKENLGDKVRIIICKKED